MANNNTLYSGFVKGRSNPIRFASNNPAMDTSRTEQDAKAKLAAHYQKGIVKQPVISQPARRASGAPAGRRVNGAMRTKGGAI